MEDKFKPKPRARRRADVERKKARVSTYQVVKPWKRATEPVPELDPRRVGMTATTHTLCSCFLCTDGRKYDRLAEKRAARREVWDS